jgi:hypothetical protein
LLRVNRVKSAQQIQLAIVIRCRVAQNCYLNVHPATIKTHIPRIGTNKLHPLKKLVLAAQPDSWQQRQDKRGEGLVWMF